MNSWVQSPESGLSFTSSLDRATVLSQPSTLFGMIPPERVGIQGEYDHEGLAKRIRLAFCDHLEAEDLDRLRITQRGRVVVLVGSVANQQTLTQLVDIALEVYGTATVETHGVTLRSAGIVGCV
ncbi:MAG: phospholipid-binding protein [Leptolyngbyaceae cyanobacterium CSU_1_3]|nr:phospholipid-binding protein [Leptolyngbyaceae cyanobacterium CSU_1_3]